MWSKVKPIGLCYLFAGIGARIDMRQRAIFPCF
jgi:hypothetical protein